MKTYEKLYQAASQLERNWEEREGVDWQEAEDLIGELFNMEISDRGELQGILTYAAANDEWDSEEVAGWPQAITLYLEMSDKDYTYRSDGENWEVYGYHMSGEEDWAGTVCTETAAIGFVDLLCGRLTKAAA